MTHEKEIQRWSTTPDGTGVWYRYKNDTKWDKLNAAQVGWHDWCIYIVDDEYAELRKAEADGKTIQISNRNQTIWSDWSKPGYSEGVINYRIKPEDIYYYQWEQISENQDVIEISNFLNNEVGDLLKNDGWRKIESSKRTWDE